MDVISKIAWNSNGVEVINDTDVNSIYFWLNEKQKNRNRAFKFTSRYKKI